MNRLKDLRTDRSLTQAELGEKVGVSGMAISYYEREERGMKPSDVDAFCRFFGVTADYLLGRTKYPQPSMSEADALILIAYQKADKDRRTIVETALRPYIEEIKKGGSAAS